MSSGTRRAGESWPLVVVVAAALGAAGCPAAPPATPPAIPAAAAYQALTRQPTADAPARGTVDGDFAWASTAATVDEAIGRWEAFLAAHGQEIEDGYARLRVDAARLELARAYYLAGEPDRGDEVMKDLDPLDIF